MRVRAILECIDLFLANTYGYFNNTKGSLMLGALLQIIWLVQAEGLWFRRQKLVKSLGPRECRSEYLSNSLEKWHQSVFDPF